MDTKWRKSKIVLSFTALVVGTVLLVGNFLTMMSLIGRDGANGFYTMVPGKGLRIFGTPDYQDTDEFAWYMSQHLEEMIGAAIGGWDHYGENGNAGYTYEDVSQAGGGSWGFFGSQTTDRGLVTGEAVTEPVPAEEAQTEQAAGSEADISGSYDVKQWMKEQAMDKNLRYAVLYRGVLIYTNIEELEPKLEQKVEPWSDEETPPGMYNFFLWYNRDKDGRVTALKDGKALDIYGNGVYTADSKWFVPGYQNFKADEAIGDVQIFMAAIKEPSLYITGNKSGYGSNQYGGWMYYKARELRAAAQQMQQCVLGLLAAILLLILARVSGRERKEAVRAFLGNAKKRELRLPIQRRLLRRENHMLWCALVTVLLLGMVIFLVFTGNYVRFGYGSFPSLLITFLAAASAVLMLLTSLWSTRKNKKLALDLGRLEEQITRVREGDLSTPLVLQEDGDLRAAAEKLNTIQAGLREALEDQMKSERMKVELVANVSHDIKTPLTSIISYIELLKQEEELPDYVKDYIRILGEKAERLKTMVQDVFEVSKAASGNLPVNPELLDFGKLLRQTLADMAEQIEASPVSVRTAIPEEGVYITADGQRIYRVVQNLLANALKYSLKGSRVYVTLTEEQGRAVATMKNTSATEIPAGIDFTERFVRGDKSRTDGGSGLGLSIASSFTEACGGQFAVEADADLFTVTVSFPVHKLAVTEETVEEAE